MFCVIQKVINKKANPYGEHKEIFSKSFTITVNGETSTRYRYEYGDERFERPIRDAYKISIHKSFRVDGKPRKWQWVICTMTYYNLLDFWPGDCLNSALLKIKLDEMGITEEQLWEMVYEKLDPIVEAVKKEFENTYEFKTKEKHQKLLEKYRAEKLLFESKYGADTYDYCYDVFGALRNKTYLKKLELQHQAQEQRKTNSSYYGNSQSNYSNTDDFFKNFSGYFDNKQSTYTDDQKGMLKKIYRALSQKFHPDITKDDGEIMKFINKLKDGWGI